jgi:hypothetical protein
MPYQIAPSWHILHDIIIASPALTCMQPYPGVSANDILSSHLVVLAKDLSYQVPLNRFPE